MYLNHKSQLVRFCYKVWAIENFHRRLITKFFLYKDPSCLCYNFQRIFSLNIHYHTIRLFVVAWHGGFVEFNKSSFFLKLFVKEIYEIMLCVCDRSIVNVWVTVLTIQKNNTYKHIHRIYAFIKNNVKLCKNINVLSFYAWYIMIVWHLKISFNL